MLYYRDTHIHISIKYQSYLKPGLHQDKTEKNTLVFRSRKNLLGKSVVSLKPREKIKWWVIMVSCIVCRCKDSKFEDRKVTAGFVKIEVVDDSNQSDFRGMVGRKAAL